MIGDYGMARIPDNSLLTETMRNFVKAADATCGIPAAQAAPPKPSTVAEYAVLHAAASRSVARAIAEVDRKLYRPLLSHVIPAGMPCTCRSRPQRLESSNFPGWRRCCACKGFRSPLPLLRKH